MDIQIDTQTQKDETSGVQKLETRSSAPSSLMQHFAEDTSDEPAQNLAFSCPIDHDGSSVYVQGWARPHNDQPPVIFVHDLGENVELYAGAAGLLVKNGFNVFGFDLRGHGRSMALTGDVLRFQDLVNDLLQVVAWIRHKSNRKKPFLIGQGVGSLILMHFQRTYPQYVQRCLLLSPILQEQTVLPFFSRLLVSGMAQLFPGTRVPRFLLPYFLPLSDESKERGLDAALVITARFAQELLQAIRTVEALFESLDSNILFICPIDDLIYNSALLHKLVGQNKNRDQLEVFEVKGISAHALSSDPEELERLFQVLLPWMRSRCELSATS
ncbi:MAG TPA: alpha/beta fold hydrolase [Oligoflexus sp.]|uniref:alpha/beta hydrolase n=1 Tax=Oligoflexus sp. TaxID=1971216 RepID=UPI002D4DBFCF|nr:alpha/beta fold hydrolase [Oligoflexus sp.]HYX37126.1 alpha/beta fold hydrolase [Oligoflexus sp.]